MRLIDGDALKEAIATRDVHDTIRRKLLQNERMAFEWTKGDMYGMVLDAPTIDAIPVEWLEKRRQNMILAAMVHSTVYGDNSVELCHAVNVVLDMWQKEQEAQDGKA